MKQPRREPIVWCYRPGPADVVRCARCGQPCMPFPSRDSRLCATCVRAVITAWPDPRQRGIVDLVQTLLATVPDDPAALVAPVIERELGVERCEVFVREVRPDEVARAVETVREGGWDVVVPLRAAERTVGLLALGPKPHGEAFTDADRDLLALVGAALGVALERARPAQGDVESVRAERLAALGMAAAGAAHEIRNQLVPVKTLLDVLPERLADPQLMAQRELALEELRKAIDLVGDLLALGMPREAHMASVLVETVVEWVVRLLEPTARRRDVALTVRSGGAVPPVRADADRLKQILVNLALNAIEASPAGHVVTLEIRPAAHRARRAAVIEVRDEGPGIPPEQVAHVFEPFFTTRPSGTGLGLALVRRMVRELGGTVGVESERGRGTVFRVTLPVTANGNGDDDGERRWRRPTRHRRPDARNAEPARKAS